MSKPLIDEREIEYFSERRNKEDDTNNRNERLKKTVS